VDARRPRWRAVAAIYWGACGLEVRRSVWRGRALRPAPIALLANSSPPLPVDRGTNLRPRGPGCSIVMSVGGAALSAMRSGAPLTGKGEGEGGMPRGRRSNRLTRCRTNTNCKRDGRGGLLGRASDNSPLMASRAFFGRPHTATRTKLRFLLACTVCSDEMKAGFPRAAAVYRPWRDLPPSARVFHPLPLPSGHPCPPARRRAADPRAGEEGVMIGGAGTGVPGGATAGCVLDYRCGGGLFWVCGQSGMRGEHMLVHRRRVGGGRAPQAAFQGRLTFLCGCGLIARTQPERRPLPRFSKVQQRQLRAPLYVCYV